MFSYICNFFAVYEAGKAVKKGIPSQYAPTLYAPSMYSQPMSAIQLQPMPNGMALAPQNGYGRDYDGASSGRHCSLQNFIFVFKLKKKTDSIHTMKWTKSGTQKRVSLAWRWTWLHFFNCVSSGAGITDSTAARSRWWRQQWVNGKHNIHKQRIVVLVGFV